MEAPLQVRWHYETLEGVLARLDLAYLRCGRTGAEVWDHLVASKQIEWSYERTPALDAVQALTVWARKCSGRGW